MNPILSTALQTGDDVKDAAARTRHNLVAFGVEALKLANAVRAKETLFLDSTLKRVGLQRRSSATQPIVYFLAGAAVVGSAALLLAPSSGKKLRRKIGALFGAPKRTEMSSVIAVENTSATIGGTGSDLADGAGPAVATNHSNG